MILSLVSLLALAPPAQDTARFQQGVEYRIEARLDEASDVLHGRARLRYTNHSAATLDTLWFHQHLNAFRPNSAWARRELELGVRRFQDLGPQEHAFERFRAVEVEGQPVRPVYPLAPDSTVVGVPLPAPLAPGATVTVRLDWAARLSTLPRRQGRAGRHYDWAQWYPRIAVYEASGWQTQPLLPQGEFYGEFARFDVTLDVAEDQVLGATGTPVEGDPGWARAAAAGHEETARGYLAAVQRSATGPAPDTLGLLGAPEPGRKRVRWVADQVHHFAWSADPAFTYEGGGGVEVRCRGAEGNRCLWQPPIHVLYLPGDTAWDEGVVVERTQSALRWLQELFGRYPWPQLTVLHRLEGGGTEFPMLVMNGSASEGLIVHEVTHQYLHGILANNEWREGWLDEGFTSFVTNWYFEDRGAEGVWDSALRSVRERERRAATQPIATPGAEFRDPGTYSSMTYTKTSLVLRMLRELVGEQTMRRITQEYFDRHALQQVTESDLRRVAEAVSGRELDWFFDQWMHTTHTLDYALADTQVERLGNGRWRTRVQVLRLGEAWMPVELRVGSVTRTLESRERSQVVEVVTRERPREVVLDPRNVLLDLDVANNRTEL